MLKSKTSILGINLAGHISGEFGLGQAARGTLASIEAADIPFSIRDLKVEWQSNSDDTYTHISQENIYPVNCIYTNPNWVKATMEGYFKNINFYEYLQGKYNIGVWLWELPKFPDDWKFAFDLFDEVWAPSNYTAEAISTVSPVPVITIPISIDLPQPSLGLKELGLPEDKFILLFIFDFGSSFERKNPIATIKAFQKAFAQSNKDVLLVLKFSNSKIFPQKRDKLYALTEDWPSIHLIDRHLTKDELHALVSNCNCYVSLHHAEGYGLTMTEAMFYGKPVIATGYSSNMDFMNVGNSFPVKYDLIETVEDYGPFPKGSIWAEPDVDRAADLMQYVFNNYEEAEKIGTQAAEDIKSILSPLAVGKKIKTRLEHIQRRTNNWTSPAKEISLLEMQAEKNWLASQLQGWKLASIEVQKELENSEFQLRKVQAKLENWEVKSLN